MGGSPIRSEVWLAFDTALSGRRASGTSSGATTLTTLANPSGAWYNLAAAKDANEGHRRPGQRPASSPPGVTPRAPR